MYNRLLVQSICMTGSDLNSSSKPWDVQFNTSKVVYEEFYEQVNKICLLTLQILAISKNNIFEIKCSLFGDIF